MTQVLLVTSWGETICGIAEHSRQVIAAVAQADPTIQILPSAGALDPSWLYAGGRLRAELDGCGLIHLNYHAGLHSRWTPEIVRYWQTRGWKVLITFHDTGVPNSEQCRALHAVADAFVIHEPADDLPGAHYWRMGVPDYTRYASLFPARPTYRPFLGTAGFDFGWKCYDELAKVSHAQGWGLLICCPEMSAEREAALRQLNPWVEIARGLPQDLVIASLHACDATAFTYVCHNTGQSAAILLGIAARKPVIALSTCRQMRALYADDLGWEVIHWVKTFEEVALALRRMLLGPFAPGICALAEQESWTPLGQKYAALYQELTV